MKPDPQFVVNLKGKEFVRYAGLLDLAHRHETWTLKEIRVKPLQLPSPDGKTPAITQALVIFLTPEGLRQFKDIAEAGPDLAPALKSSALRVCSTRAKARALRDALNIEAEILEDEGAVQNPGAAGRPSGPPTPPPAKRPQPPAARTAAKPAAAAKPDAAPPQRARHDPQDHAERCAPAWKPGKPNEDGELEPITEEQIGYLTDLARSKGAPGRAWLLAIGRAETTADGRDLRARLKALPDPAPALPGADAENPPNAQRTGH
jgi:hypothetical protein